MRRIGDRLVVPLVNRKPKHGPGAGVVMQPTVIHRPSRDGYMATGTILFEGTAEPGAQVVLSWAGMQQPPVVASTNPNTIGYWYTTVNQNTPVPWPVEVYAIAIHPLNQTIQQESNHLFLWIEDVQAEVLGPTMDAYGNILEPPGVITFHGTAPTGSLVTIQARNIGAGLEETLAQVESVNGAWSADVTFERGTASLYYLIEGVWGVAVNPPLLPGREPIMFTIGPVAVTSPTIPGSLPAGDITFQGTCDPAATKIETMVVGPGNPGELLEANLSNGNWSRTYNLAAGSYTFQVMQTWNGLVRPSSPPDLVGMATWNQRGGVSTPFTVS